MKLTTPAFVVLCLGLTCHALAAEGVDKGAPGADAGLPAGALAVRRFVVMPNVLERVAAARNAPAPAGERSPAPITNANLEVRDWLGTQGVAWPAGATLAFLEVIDTLSVHNTPANLDRIQEILNELGVTRRQVQIDVQFVAYDLADIARVAATGKVNIASLTGLWVNGRGELLAAPTVVTLAGQEAVTKGVTEYIYPTQFTMTGLQNGGTNAFGSGAVFGAVSEPGAFQTREVGAIEQVVPEVSAGGQMISLTMNPQIVCEPLWEDFGYRYKDNQVERHLPMRQPFFHVYSASTSVSVQSGKRVLLGGGMPSRDGKKLVYAFVTATLVDATGAPLKIRDDDRPTTAK
jgi:type II secretory pathway component GspD/PulD (secretin)